MSENKENKNNKNDKSTPNPDDQCTPEAPSIQSSNISLLEIPELRCPLCPKFSNIKINHLENEIISECPDNHYMKLDLISFLEKSADHPIKNTKCSICSKNENSITFCLECNKYFCNECLEKHNNNNLPFNNGGVYSSILGKNPNQSNISNNNSIINIDMSTHHVINIDKFDNYCAIHNDEKYIAYCKNCARSFCKKCLEDKKISVLNCKKSAKHQAKKYSDAVNSEKIKKIKNLLAKENETINEIEKRANLIIETLMNKINILKDIHLLKEQLFNLYMKNQNNTYLNKTMENFPSQFTINLKNFNSNEILLENLGILRINKNENEIKKQKQNEGNKEKGTNNKENAMISSVPNSNKNNFEEDKKQGENKNISKKELEKIKKEKLKKEKKNKDKKEDKKEVKKEEINNNNSSVSEHPIDQSALTTLENADNKNENIELNNGNK